MHCAFFALFNGFQVLLLKQDIDNQSLPNQMFLWTNKQQAWKKNPPFSIADSATFTFLLVYHKHDRSTFSINWWVRQCDPNHLINGTERSTGSALSSWSSLSGFDWGHYYHKHSCLLFSLSLSVTVMLCREKKQLCWCQQKSRPEYYTSVHFVLDIVVNLTLIVMTWVR